MSTSDDEPKTKDATPDDVRRERENATDAEGASDPDVKAVSDKGDAIKREGSERAATAAMAHRPAG